MMTSWQQINFFFFFKQKYKYLTYKKIKPQVNKFYLQQAIFSPNYVQN